MGIIAVLCSGNMLLSSEWTTTVTTTALDKRSRFRKKFMVCMLGVKLTNFDKTL